MTAPLCWKAATSNMTASLFCVIFVKKKWLTTSRTAVIKRPTCVFAF